MERFGHSRHKIRRKLRQEQRFITVLWYLSSQRQLQRNVVPLLKVQIVDYLCKGQARQSKYNKA